MLALALGARDGTVTLSKAVILLKAALPRQSCIIRISNML